jgi:hypothetical protein
MHFLQQGDALSRAKFSTELEEVIRNIKINLNGKILKERDNVAYADDMVIFGRSLRATEEVVTQIKEVAVSTEL